MNAPVPILLYHSVASTAAPRFRKWALSPEMFAAHMAYLHDQRYTPLTVTQLVRAMAAKAEGWPSRPIVISFDDGYADFLVGAWPSLKQYVFAATLYVVTKYVGQNSGWLHGQGAGDRLMLSWAQLAEIGAAGIECGAHSHTHVQLDTVPIDVAREEIVRSKNEIEQHLNQPAETFAYPYGYYTPAVRELVQAAGFSSACAVKHALSTTTDDRFALARIIVSADTTVERLADLLTGRDLRIAPAGEQLWTKAWRMIRRLRRLTQSSTREAADKTRLQTMWSRLDQ